MSFPVTTVKIAGPAGAGIKSSGLLLSEILLAHGFNLKDYNEYPSLVRGGHNTYQVSFSEGEVLAPHFNVDLFFSLIPDHWQRHQTEFNKKTIILGEGAPVNLPLREFTAQLGAAIYANTICLGVAVYLLALDHHLSQKIISRHFGTDSPNNQAFELGFDYASQNFSQYKIKNLNLIKNSKLKIKNSAIYDGNEAYGWGFIRGGGNFYAAYPMTPASGALHLLAAQQEKYNISVIHPEDEIAGASLAVGASFAGARSATGSSGGGFALMVESVSFAGAANIGTVFYLVSRPGPATGLPSWTSQGDLLFAVNAGHGEFNKIVLAPGSQAESFDFSVGALNLAAKFNIPVIVISDKFIAESASSLPDLSQTKVKIINTTRALPGTPGGEYLANSYEHDEHGFSTEDAVVVAKNVNRRLALTQTILKSLPKPVFYGNESAKKLIITWGGPTGPVLEAVRTAKNPSEYAVLQIRSLWPINPELELLIKPFRDITVVENNAFSQLTTLLKSQFDFHPVKTLLKYDGRPFYPEEIADALFGAGRRTKNSELKKPDGY